MKTKRFKEIKIPILGNEYSVYIIWGGTNEKRLKWIRNFHDDDSIVSDNWQSARARTHLKSGYIPVIHLGNGEFVHSEVAHEACHAIDYIFKHIGSDDREEIFAMSVGVIVREFEKFIIK